MSFTTIKDQDNALRLLRNVLLKRRIPSGMLFWGPDGVGKRLVAIEMAKAVNCVSSSSDACDVCLSCRKVKSGNHPDIRLVMPARKTRVIDDETIETIMEFASLRGYESLWRVFVLEDADRMTTRAQNRFLKTLEEPPGNSLFILTSSYPRDLLPTIRSRCLGVRFRSLRPETVESLLIRDRQLPLEEARSIASLSQGQMSRAISLIDSGRRVTAMALARRLASGEDPVVLAEEFSDMLDAEKKRAEAIIDADLQSEAQDIDSDERERLKNFKMASLAAMQKSNLIDYLYLLQTWCRDMLVILSTGDTRHIMNQDQASWLQQCPMKDPAAGIQAVQRAVECLDLYVTEDRVFRDLFFALSAA